MIVKDEIRKITRTGELLVQRGVIDEELLEKAILIQSTTTKYTGNWHIYSPFQKLIWKKRS